MAELTGRQQYRFHGSEPTGSLCVRQQDLLRNQLFIRLCFYGRWRELVAIRQRHHQSQYRMFHFVWKQTLCRIHRRRVYFSDDDGAGGQK